MRQVRQVKSSCASLASRTAVTSVTDVHVEIWRSSEVIMAYLMVFNGNGWSTPLFLETPMCCNSGLLSQLFQGIRCYCSWWHSDILGFFGRSADSCDLIRILQMVRWTQGMRMVGQGGQVNSQGRLEVLTSTLSLDSSFWVHNEATCQLLVLDGPPDGKCTSVRERHQCWSKHGLEMHLMLLREMSKRLGRVLRVTFSRDPTQHTWTAVACQDASSGRVTRVHREHLLYGAGVCHRHFQTLTLSGNDDIYLSMYLPICLSVYVSTYLSIYLSIYQSFFIIIYHHLSLSIIIYHYLYHYLSTYLSTYLSNYLSNYLTT